MPARLRLIAGPNGSGKTTLTNNIRQNLGEQFGIYVNADELEKDHSVPQDKILSRYVRSLNNLLPAIRQTSRAFLYDNSGTEHKEVAQITEGNQLLFDTTFVPFWFEDYVLKKI